jgi:hypothetical protein
VCDRLFLENDFRRAVRACGRRQHQRPGRTYPDRRTMRQRATFRFQGSGYRSDPAMPYETGVSRQLSYNYLRRDTKSHCRSMERMDSLVAVLVVAAAVSLLLPSRSHALTPDRDIAQYAHRLWKIDDGYFGSNPYSLARQRRLSLDRNRSRSIPLRWRSILALESACRYAPAQLDHLQSLADRDGSLWIGTLAVITRRRTTLLLARQFRERIHEGLVRRMSSVLHPDFTGSVRT